MQSSLLTAFVLSIFFLIPTTANAGSISLPPNNLGLVGYWSMEDGVGTTATDFSGNGNTGTLTNMDANTDWVDGKYGKALEFDGVDDYISYGTSIGDLSGDFTVSYWMSAVKGQDQKIIVGKTSAWSASPGSGWWMSARSDGTVYLEMVTASGYTNIPFSSVLDNTTDWKMITLIRSGSTLYAYYNGVLINSSSSYSTGVTSSAQFAIGNGAYLDARYYAGKIDDVRIYNRALSATEIGTLYSRSKHAKIQSGVSNEGLVGYWSMEGSQDTSVDDYSGNGNIGTMTNMDTGTDYVTGYKAGSTALDFDGVDDYVNVGSMPAITGSVTVNLWFYTNTTSATNNLRVIASDSPNGAGDYVIAYGTSGLIFVRGNAVGVENSILYSNTSLHGSWHNVVVVDDRTNAYIYLDDQVVASGVSSGWSIANGTNKVIGSFNGGTGNYWNGKIDDVRIYNRALSATEIGKLYNQTKTTKINVSQNNKLTDGLVGLWSFNGQDISGTTAYDRSGQGNNGTLTNGPQPTAGKIGQGMSFDGINDYVSMSTGNLSTFTYSAWVKPASIGSYQGIITSDPTSGYYPRMSSDNGTDHFICNSAEELHNASVTASLGTANLNEWQLYTCVFTPTDVYAYRDGVLVDSNLSNPTLRQHSSATVIGRYYSTTNSLYFNGVLDDIRIYNRALSAKEIGQLYGQGRTR